MAKILRHLGIGNTRKPPTPPVPDYNNGGQHHLRFDSDGSPSQENVGLNSPEKVKTLPELQEYVDPADCQFLPFRTQERQDDDDEEGLYSEPVQQQQVDDEDVYTEPYHSTANGSPTHEELYSDASGEPSHIEASGAAQPNTPPVQYDHPSEWSAGARNKIRTPIAVIEPYRNEAAPQLGASPSLQSIESAESDEMAIRQRHMYETAFDSKVRHKIDDIDKLLQSPVLHDGIGKHQPRVAKTTDQSQPEPRNPPQKSQVVNEKRKVTLISDVPGRAKSSNPSCSEVGPDVQLQSGNPQAKGASSPKGQLDREVVSELSRKLKHRNKDQKQRPPSETDSKPSSSTSTQQSHSQGPEFDTRPSDEYDVPWDLPKVPSVPKRASGSVDLPPPLDSRPNLKLSHAQHLSDHAKVIKRSHGAEEKAAASEITHLKNSVSSENAEGSDRLREVVKNPPTKGAEARRSLNLDFDGACSSGKGMRQNLALNFGCTALNTTGEKVNAVAPLEEQQWYHGAISRLDAENLLRVLKEGSYLVRNSESSKDDYSLSLKSARGFMHMKIVYTNGKYILGQFSKPFPSIPEMINHYSNNKLPIRGAEHMSLLYPVFYQVL